MHPPCQVLASALHISPRARLVIEVKPGYTEAAALLVRLFAARPELLTAVAIVMSFDLKGEWPAS